MGLFAANKRVVNVKSGGAQIKKLFVGEKLMWEKLYTPLNYIESSGTQHINTGVIPDSNTRMILDVAVTRRTGSNIIAGNYVGTKHFGFNVSGLSTDLITYYGASAKPASGVNTNTRCLIDMDGVSLTVKVDGILIWNLQPQSYFASPSPLGVFAARLENGTSNYYSVMKLYGMKIYQSGILVRDYIPVKRDSDNVAGLFDKINHVFYINAGVGNFLTG